MKSRILLLTGKNAYEDLKNLDFNAVHQKYIFNIECLPIPTIAFVSSQQIEKFLDQFALNDFDFVITSGLIPWDLGTINSEFAVKIKKGPQFFIMLPEILQNLDPKDFSSSIPADKLYNNVAKTNFQTLYTQIKEKVMKSSPNEFFQLPSPNAQIIFSPQLPPLILGEIVDFPNLSFEKLCLKIEYYMNSGADIIDLGCIANEDNSSFIAETVPKLITRFKIPFSIDSFNVNEIHSAIQAGIQIVLSINFDNYHKLLDLPKDVVLVIVPLSTKGFGLPHTPQERIAGLLQIGKILAEHGFTNILLDPITESPISPGISQSIETLALLKRGLENLPSKDENGNFLPKPQLFMGLGNITELVDGDSSGINTLLMLIAVELGIAAILTTEHSTKTRKTIEELYQSRKLAFVAKNHNVPPINIGLNALRLKSKLKYPKYVDFQEPKEKINDNESVAIMDPKGYFKIYINHLQNKIYVTHFTNNVASNEATKTYIGINAESLYKKIIDDQKISRLDHASYLGKELYKAELALRFGTEFTQA